MTRRSLALLLAVLAACSSSHRAAPVKSSPSPSPSATPSLSTGFANIADLSFADALHGYALETACGEADCGSVFYTTSDGGKTWRSLGDFSPGHELGHVRAGSDHEAWFYDPEVALASNGKTTIDVSFPADGEPSFADAIAPRGSSVWRVDREQGCDFTDRGCVVAFYVSGNAGRSWSKPRSQPLSVARKVRLVRSGTRRGWLIALGNDDRYDGPVYATSDGARTWKALKNPCAGSAYSYDVQIGTPDGAALYLGCAEKASGKEQKKLTFRSRDGGEHWAIPNPAPTSGSGFFMAVSGPQIVWFSMPEGPVGASEDEGRTWGTRLNYKDNSGWGPIAFVDALHGWIAYDDEIFRTTDAGHHWQRVKLPG